MKKTILIISTLAMCTGFSNAVVTVTGSLNSVPITQITYTRNGATVVQNASVNTFEATTDSVYLDNVQINDGGAIKNLVVHSTTATVSNINLYNTGGVFVVKNGSTISSNTSGGEVAFAVALQDMYSNTDILNFNAYDGVNNAPVSSGDYDVMFDLGLAAGDYVTVLERNGNTYFELTPLDINGDVITNAKVLKFDSTTGHPGGYDWGTGYSSPGAVPDQPMWMTVAKVELFNTTTAVYGFRIDNNGEADIKFFGLRDVTAIPEPSSIVLLGLGVLGFLIHRKR